MKLSDLPALIGCSAGGLSDRTVYGVTEDSRRVMRGSIFVAAPGVRSDGHDYAARAVELGAIAVIGSRPGLDALCGVPYIYTARPRSALGLIAHELRGNPSRRMTVIGVTGTNGKSSSVVMIHRVLESCGFPSAALGTLGYQIGHQTLPAPHTTPFGEDLAEMFGRADEAGCSYVVMEASSHAIDQDRIAGIDFKVAAFTNLTQDHLDYHADMYSYRRAKIKLFEHIRGAGRFTVVNVDDPSAPHFIAASHVPCHTYGAGGEVRAEDIHIGLEGTRFTARTPWGAAPVEMHLLGRHNVQNALCVITVCCALGLPLDVVARGVGMVRSVPGRFERIETGRGFEVAVDYAHTDDGLRNVLEAAREVCPGRVIVVFGCGGDRDRTKRLKMGAVAARLSDFAIVTSDNPRTEEPNSIIAAIVPGVEAAGKKEGVDYCVMPDRRQAIARAVQMACPGDLVMIAGKGHEDYQILGTTKIHFDDREEARAALARLPE
ncbi:MAG: UDP-N-acetylmuramoyl-L-alanyl-D-glutamate--2,6-diaminopimelate ligase [Candidatus Hydrogenedentes bacterium]|nr:UDP-N-acetylmuramoyl-L-alanyl-D-glutamate--2,6-diaminopimelate ligase [Candidatus Hydrogenedentota bacterium]